MKRVRIMAVVAAAVLLAAFIVPAGVMAQQKVIELTYGTPYNNDHQFSKTDIKWMAKIEKETNGRVKFKPFWGGAIIGPTGAAIEEVVKGVADVGFISVGQAKTGYDIAKANFLFFIGAEQKEGWKVFKEALKKFPEIEKEYKGLKVLCWSSGADYQLLSRKPVRKLADLKGMRIKTLGEIVDVLKNLGVEGMASPMSEVYMNVQKGVLDGAFTMYSTLKVFRFAEVAKYMTETNLYRPHSGGRVMGLTTWNKLPPDIQKIFENNIEWFSNEADSDVAREEIEGRDFGAKNGVEFIKLPREDTAKFNELVMQEALKEAKKLDGKGIPGTKILTEVQKMIKQQ
jgi:TRAP-type transport system periplasmic protein